MAVLGAVSLVKGERLLAAAAGPRSWVPRERQVNLERQLVPEADRAFPLLTVNNVSCAYGKHRVLSDVDFVVRAGELVGMIGPNGSGKTTLLRLLMNLIHPTHGSVAIEETRVDELTTPELFRLGVAMTFQNPRVFGALSVIDNMMVAHRGRRSASTAHGEAMVLLERLNLSSLASRTAASCPLANRSSWTSRARQRHTPASFSSTR